MQTMVLDSDNKAVSGGFTPAQYELINMISCLRRDEDVAALKSVLVKFLDSRLQDELDRLYDDGKLTDDCVERFASSHFRTHYGVAR